MDITCLFYKCKDYIASCFIFPGIDLIQLNRIDY